MFSKSVLRKELQVKRLELCDSGNNSTRNTMLSQHVADYLRGHQPSIWASYQPRSFEADPNIELKKTPHRFAYPKVVGETLEFFEPKTKADWEKGFGGIQEPKASTQNKIEMRNLAGVLIPGVAFDSKGHRLGSGKGFYDRALAHFQGLKVGVTWEAMVVKSHSLPVEDHDIPMDVLITENCVREIRKG